MGSLSRQGIEGARAEILDCVTRVPGNHLRGVERMTGLPLGQVLYHLDRLERMGVVVSGRDAGFRRYYLASDVGRGEKKYLAALRHEVPRRLVLLLLERPGLAHKELQGLLGVAGSTLSFHLERLVASGALTRQKVGASHVYAVAEPAVARWDLVYYRESFRDPAVDRYVRRALAALPPPPPASPTAPRVPPSAPPMEPPARTLPLSPPEAPPALPS